ncbi:MAG: DUF5990 family protein [Candidatus Nanopelagicales bacterium]
MQRIAVEAQFQRRVSVRRTLLGGHSVAFKHRVTNIYRREAPVIPSDQEIAMRITVRRSPTGVAIAVQRGSAELLEPSTQSPDACVFDFTVRVGAMSAGNLPRLLGPFTQGPPLARFVYVNTGQRAGQPASPWSRRAKLPLRGITASMIQSALRTPGARIETEFEGTGTDGGPTCATVKTTVWRVAIPATTVSSPSETR